MKHHQDRQKRRFLKAWLEYLDVRRAKRQKSEMAQRFHCATVLQIHFCDWQWAWERRQSLYGQQAALGELARRMALRRAFVRWKHYVLLCAEEAALAEVAEERRRLSLLSPQRQCNPCPSPTNKKESGSPAARHDAAAQVLGPLAVSD